MDSEKQVQEQVKIAIEKQQQSPDSSQEKEELVAQKRKIPIKYYILMGIGAFTLVIFSLIMAGALNTVLCGGKNRDLFNSCNCKENYRQFKNQDSCVGPFSEMFTQEDIEASLTNQENNVVPRAYKRNLMEHFQYNLKHLQSFTDSNGTASHAETNIKYNINVLTKEVNDETVETYFIVQNSTVINDQGFELYSEGYPKIIHFKNSEDSSEQEKSEEEQSDNEQSQDDEQDVLSDWEKYHAEQLGISEERYEKSTLPIVKVVFYKDGTVESIHYPVNMDKNYKQLFDNILDQYSLPIHQEYYDQDSQYSYSPDTNQITKQDSKQDRADNGSFVDSDQKMTQTQTIENGQIKQSTLEAETEILSKADEMSGSNLFSNINFKQIVHFISQGTLLVEEEFVEDLLQVLETNFLHQVSHKEFDNLLEEENKFNEQKNLSENTVDNNDQHRNLAQNLIPLQQFTIFNFDQIGIVIQAYSQFYCNQGTSADGKDDCYINIVFRFMDSWYTEQSHFKAEVQRDTELQFSTLYNQWLINKNYGKDKRYNTVANIGLNLGATLSVQAHLKVDYYIQSNGVIRFIGTFRFTARCTGSVNVAAVAARAGVYIDATLFDGSLTLDLGASYLNNNFNGRTKMYGDALAFSASAGAYYEHWECHWRRECTTIVIEICGDVLKCNWGPRHNFYNALNSNTAPHHFNLPTVTIGNGIQETLVQLPGTSNIRHVSWQRVGGMLSHCSIDASGKAWGVQPNGNIFTRGHITDQAGWQQIGGGLKQVSVAGNHVWGVNSNDDIFYYSGGWHHIAGKLKWIDVQADGRVWGVNSADDIFTRWQSNGSWQHIGGKLKNIATANNNIVGSNIHDDAFQRTSVYGGWQHQSGIKLNQVTISENGRRWGVADNFEIYNSQGANQPWTKVNGGLKQISAAGNYLCGVGSDNSIWYAQI